MPFPNAILGDLPAMPFGLASAKEFTDEASCGAFLAALPDAPSRFGAIGDPATFRIRLRNVALPGVSVVAGSGTPKATDHCSRRLALVIPFGGVETVLRSGREEHRWAAPHHAFFIPAGEKIEAESSGGSFLRLDLVETAITTTAAGMPGLEKPLHHAVDLSRSRIVPLQARGMNWLPVIRSLCSTIDAFDCDATRLVAAGFDDVLLRTAVMMLCPEMFLQQQWAVRQARGIDLDPLLERIEANLGGRVTLAEIEAWSGRTARAIQLAFQKRFGIGPMQWVRERRLDLIRTKLLAARSGDTVRGIAASCGITRMATLIPEYAARFGERPSDTLRSADR
jgi:AraC-like DNA-binding protein